MNEQSFLQLSLKAKRGPWLSCLFLILALINTVCFTVKAQDLNLSFKHLTINEGLSQNTVFCIFQDSYGFIWIGTEDGLNRFDGYEFKIFKKEPGNQRSLVNNQINVIAEDEDKNLIIGSAGGVSIFNRGTEDFKNILIPGEKKNAQSDNFVTGIVPEGNGRIWFATYNGLELYDSRSGRFISNSVSKALRDAKIKAVCRDNKNVLWLSYGNVVGRLDLKRKKFVPVPAAFQNSFSKNPGDIRVIRQDHQGNMWFGTEQAGLFFLDASGRSCINYINRPNDPGSLPVNVVRDVFFQENGEVWVATRKGLSVLDVKRRSFITFSHDKYNPESLSHRSVLCILKDKGGSIWIGTFAGGVNVYSPLSANFSKIGEQLGNLNGINNPVVSSILQDKNGNLWIGTEGGGLNYFNRSAKQFQVYGLKKNTEEFSENLIKSLSQDQNGNLWVGAFDGLYYFDVTSHVFSKISFKKDPDYPGRSQVYAVLADGEGVWAGTNGGGLLYHTPGKAPLIYTNNPKDAGSISGNHISSLLKDEKGNLWIGTLQGLNYFDKKTKRFTRYVFIPGKNSGLSNNNVTSLFLDSGKHLWIGTRGGGLNFFDPRSGNFTTFSEKNGLANDVVRAINQDQSGNLWVSTNKGISKLRIGYTKSQKVPGITEVKNYSKIDGLQSNQFLSGSTLKLASGELFFGGIDGITSFNPETMKVNRHLPTVVFTDFLVNSKSLPINSESSLLDKHINEVRNITLPYEQANFSIKFAALNFINSDKNQYAYKLEGFSNDDWHYVGDQRTATYTNLNPGQYVFQVKAANNDGYWNDSLASIHIHILPPWYKTWWAYLIYLVVFSSLLYYFYYFSYKTIHLKNELRFEQMSHEKDQELAQRKLSFFTHISHEIKTPLTLILSPIEKLLSQDTLDNKVQNQLQIIYRNGERLMRITNQLLDYRKFDTGNMKLQAAEGNFVRFTTEVLAAFQSYALSKEIDLQLVSEHKSIRVWFDRDKMEKVLFNLISNALKFTRPGGFIHVKLRLSSDGNGGQGRLVLEVEDNGIGIAKENLPTIFNQFQHFDTNGENQQGTGLGLSFSKGLIELHHGSIEVESRQAVGETPGCTRFTVSLLLGKEHLNDAEIIPDYSNSEDINGYSSREITAVSEKINEKKQIVRSLSEPQKLIMLIVEDNKDVLQFVESNFQEDFEVHTAVDGAQGWEAAVKLIPDIIISDVMMPLVMGTELCAKVKSDIRTSHIPVILLTAREPLLYKIEGLETGADDYMTKPFNLKYLEMRVWNLLESRIKLRERYSKKLTMQPSTLAITSPDEKFLEKAIKFIEENISESTLGVEELSKEVGMSKTTLYRKLKALTNQNTNEFIRSVRLNVAAQMLSQKKFNVNEVAYHVGFSNLDYFRKCFKEQFGSNPKDFSGKMLEHQS